MENMRPNGCSTMDGTLPGKCADLVFPYVPKQCENPERYEHQAALETGTLFPGLNLPFYKTVKTKMNCENRALCELMALHFAVTELGLFLDTHKNDREALQLYREYAALAAEGKKRYEAMYGPLCQSDLTDKDGWSWIDGPWPWEYEGGRK